MAQILFRFFRFCLTEFQKNPVHIKLYLICVHSFQSIMIQPLSRSIRFSPAGSKYLAREILKIKPQYIDLFTWDLNANFVLSSLFYSKCVLVSIFQEVLLYLCQWVELQPAEYRLEIPGDFLLSAFLHQNF